MLTKDFSPGGVDRNQPVTTMRKNITQTKDGAPLDRSDTTNKYLPLIYLRDKVRNKKHSIFLDEVGHIKKLKLTTMFA